MHGQFAHYELTTSDAEAARKFYPTFTGWKTQAFDNDYTLFTSGGVPVAGVFALTEEMRSQGIPPSWMPYIEVKNVADTTKLANSLGGKIMFGPESIPDVGDIAVIQDPQGAVFGVYRSSSGAPSWDGTPVVGNFSWNELMTPDHSAAFDFYRRLFGWDKIDEMDMGGGIMYRTFGKGEKMYGGMYTTPREMSGMHPFWLCYIHVKDVPAALATATGHGASVHRPPMDIPGGVIAILGDPQGAGFALHHQNGASAGASTAKAGSNRQPAKSKAVAAKKSKKVATGKSRATVKKSRPAAKKAKPVVRRSKKAAKPAAKKKSAARSARKSARSASAKSSKARKSARKTARRPAKKK
jgi:uncharacterized protein